MTARATRWRRGQSGPETGDSRSFLTRVRARGDGRAAAAPIADPYVGPICPFRTIQAAIDTDVDGDSIGEAGNCVVAVSADDPDEDFRCHPEPVRRSGASAGLAGA